MTKIYFASPLFSEMELAFNKVLVEKIRHQFPGVEVYLPTILFSSLCVFLFITLTNMSYTLAILSQNIF